MLQLHLLVGIVIAICCAASAETLRSNNVGQLSVPEIEDAIQVSQTRHLSIRLEGYKLLIGISNARLYKS